MSGGKVGVGRGGISFSTVLACSTLGSVALESCHESLDCLGHGAGGGYVELGGKGSPVLLDIPSLEPCFLKIDLSGNGGLHVGVEVATILDKGVLG